MLRTFKQYMIVAGGTPQPLIGTTLNGAIGANTDPDTPFTITVTDSSMFTQADTIAIGKPSTSSNERLQVTKVSDGTHITVRGVLRNAYPSGTYVRLAMGVNSVYVQTKDGNSGTMYIGTADNMVTGTMSKCVCKLMAVSQGTQPIEFKDGRSGPWNFDDSGEIWIDGTTGDGYTPTLGIV